MAGWGEGLGATDGAVSHAAVGAPLDLHVAVLPLRVRLRVTRLDVRRVVRLRVTIVVVHRLGQLVKNVLNHLRVVLMGTERTSRHHCPVTVLQV